MALLDKLPKKPGGGKGRKVSKRSLPVKRSINLAATGEKNIQASVAIPAIVLIVVAAVLVSKFAVIDRLAAVTRAEREVTAMQDELEQRYETLRQFGELTDEYAHYTYSGMTQEELNRTDRVAVLNLIQRVVLKEGWVSSWTVSSNILTLDITRGDLQEINLLAQELNEQEIVDFCTVTTAATTNTSGSERATQTLNSDVTGQVVVYLKNVSGEEVEQQAASDAEESSTLERAIDKTANTLDALAQAADETERLAGEG